MNRDNTSLTPMQDAPPGPHAVGVGISRDRPQSGQREVVSEEIEYQSVPPRRSVRVRVRYRAAERGRPLRIVSWQHESLFMK
jgi:hypothetical protein